MKNTYLLKLLAGWFIFSLFFGQFMSSCCCKKGCVVNGLFINEDINIAFSGFTDRGYDSIYSGQINLGNDSVFLKEYDLTSGQLLKSTLVTSPYLELGQAYVLKDSFYLNKRYFIITRPGETDTINNIAYQIELQPYCNNCIGDHNYAPRVANFTYNYIGHQHAYSDTIFLKR